tara:strand:+ start:153 stop:548 length:396 start_codon:yes stop_codon:yes gene_type:complete
MSKQNKALQTQQINDVNIAAAMFSLGFEQERTAIQIKKRNGRIQFVYFFKPKSTCGRYVLKECLAAWTDENFLAENPFHELSAMRAFSENRFQLLGEIKAQQGMLTEVSSDGVEGLINLAAPKENLQKLFS